MKTLKLKQKAILKQSDENYDRRNKTYDLSKVLLEQRSEEYLIYILKEKMLNNLVLYYEPRSWHFQDNKFKIGKISFNIDISKNKKWKDLIAFWKKEERCAPSEIKSDLFEISYSSYGNSLTEKGCIISIVFDDHTKIPTFLKKFNCKLSPRIDEAIAEVEVVLNNLKFLKEEFTK